MFNSLESANLWSNIFNGMLIFGAATILIGTIGAVRTAAVKERYSDGRIAANEAEAKRAIADSDAAKEGTAKAHERIAELSLETEKAKADIAASNAAAAEANRKAEQERLERLRLQAAVAPRSIELQQQQVLIGLFRSLAGKSISVTSYSLDGDGANLATQIIAVLERAGVTVQNRIASFMPLGGFSLGVHVTGSDVASSDIIRRALAASGLVVAPPSPTAAAQVPSEATTAVDILVGIKPIPIIK